jgi:hypothetical protein
LHPLLARFASRGSKTHKQSEQFLMRTHRRHTLSIVHRFLSVSLLALSSMVWFSELSASLLATSSTLARAGGPAFERFSARESIARFHWNLSDDDLPLISLPDHVDRGIDLSLSYSMDQFQFPLFQSLYYNVRVGKYILMVIPNEGRRAEFIDLDPVKGAGQFAAKGNSHLRLVDKGYTKVLSTSEGATYTFAHFADGEFHCSRISDRNGVVIKLKYTNDASIDSIADALGRTISFSYTNDYVSSISQTWGAKSIKKKTWAIADNVGRANGPAVNLVPRAVTAKHIPTNAIKPGYTEQMAASDAMLATIFGGPRAVAAANGFEPLALASQYPAYRGDLIGDDGKIRRGHLSYAMHLYGSADGTGDSELYVPPGFISHSSVPTPTDAAVTFYYPRLGNFTNVTLAVFHVANFLLSYEAGRVCIGNIGGPGGSIASYKHSHLEFYRGDTGLPPAALRPQLRIDPATVFESIPETASRSKSQTSARSSY